MKKSASYYGNVLQRDQPHLGDEDKFWSLPGDVDRFEEKPIKLDSDNYLYDAINTDRFNSPRHDFEQTPGQPKGVVPKMEPVKDMESSVTADEAGEMIDPVLTTFSNEDEKMVDEIKKAMLDD